jgi:hypothetical protein
MHALRTYQLTVDDDVHALALCMRIRFMAMAGCVLKSTSHSMRSCQAAYLSKETQCNLLC